MTGFESRSRQIACSCSSLSASDSISMNLPMRTDFTPGRPWWCMASRTATPCGSSTLCLGMTVTLAFIGKEVLRSLVLRSSLFGGDDFDLDLRAARQAGHLDGGAGRKGLGEVLRVDGVHGRELAEVDEKDGRFEDVREGHAIVREDGFDVLAD